MRTYRLIGDQSWSTYGTSLTTEQHPQLARAYFSGLSLGGRGIGNPFSPGSFPPGFGQSRVGSRGGGGVGRGGGEGFVFFSSRGSRDMGVESVKESRGRQCIGDLLLHQFLEVLIQARIVEALA